MFKTRKWTLFIFFLSAGLIAACTSTKKIQKKNKKTSSSKHAKKKSGLKPYKKVITDEAQTQQGLFPVHKIDDKYYYEIPDSLIGRDMLLVSRISKTAENLGFGGQKLNTQVIRWQRRDNDIFLRHESFSNVANDSLPIHKAVQNSNLAPILANFDVKSLGKDSSGVVIDVTDLYSKDTPSLGLQNRQRKQYKVRRLDKDRSFIKYIHSYPKNIEVRKVFSYNASKAPSNAATNTITVEINHSMVLLPKEPMRSRRIDPRVGYFSVSQTDFGSDAQKAKDVQYATRYELVPKDKEAYMRGELVEPVEPIVYYIDSATPEKWRSYLKKGIEDWQEAFETAGFKNAIIAKDAPTAEEDSTFSPEDVRYSVIRYFASHTQNAMGPNVHDPRSGQIFESDINWHHNIMNLLRNWYFVQTAAANPDARGVDFSDETMGELVRFVSSHELGHTLGLRHNFASSSAYPVDSLRSPSFTSTHGTAPSIMDYARFNYVAQPGDGVTSFHPGIGKYDKWAIKWAYSWFPKSESPEDIRKTLNKWVKERAGDPVYFFGGRGGDPRGQSEDLGDNAMKASRYGIANLKRIMNHLVEWTAQPGETYEDLDELYGQIIGQWGRYMGHVVNNVGGVYKTDKTYDQEGVVYEPVPAKKQKEAVNFLSEQAFKTPTWMVNADVLDRINGTSAVNDMRSRQAGVLNRLMDPMRIGRLIEMQARYDGPSYSAYNMMDDVRKSIWNELDDNNKISVYRRNLQRAYLDRMNYLMTEEIPERYKRFGSLSVDIEQSDIRPIVVDQLQKLQNQVKRTKRRVSERTTRLHLENVSRRIDRILNPDA